MAGQRLARVTKKTLLIVEGKEDELFFSALANRLGITKLQVLAIGGKTQLRGNLKARPPGFRSVASLGIIRDANSDPHGAFRSVCDALENAGLSVPPAVGEPAGSEPRVIVLILPDGQNPGMLEDVCLQSIQNHPVTPCIDQFFECVGGTAKAPREPSKARVHAFLSSRETPDLRLGEAAEKGYWPFEDPAFHLIKEFLRKLCSAM